MAKKKAPKKTPAKPKADDAQQGERFKAFAKEVGADDEEAFERLFKKAVPPKKPAKRK